MITLASSTALATISATAQSAVDKANEAISIANGANTTINNITYSVGSGYEWYFNNATKRADYMLMRQCNTAKANKMLTANTINLKDTDIAADRKLE